MESAKPGFDSWFQDKKTEFLGPDCKAARVTAVNRDTYLVRGEGAEVLAELSGAFTFAAVTPADFPVVGDWAAVQYYNQDSLAIIHRLFPRRTLLRRKAAGKTVDFQLLAANIDTALIIQAADFDFNVRRLERYLVMVRDGGIEPVILLSKSDLVGADILGQRIADVRGIQASCRVLPYSAETGLGLEDIRCLLQPGKTYCLLGSSGVGKTTLLNRLLGKNAFETKTVRADDGKGRHTTSRRQLVSLASGAFIIDTPGIRELGNIAVAGAIGGVFGDVSGLSGQCRFKDCTHRSEAGCAVLEAVAHGRLPEDRYQSYLKLLKESVHNEMSYAERRHKDREFGRFIKSVTKLDKRNIKK